MANPSYIDEATGELTDGEAWVALGPLDTVNNPLTATATSVTFTDPSDGSSLDWCQFSDLVVIWYARSAHSIADDRMQIRLGNGSGVETGNYYAYQNLLANGTNRTVSSGAGTYSSFLGGNFPGNSAAADAFGCSILEIQDFNSAKYKSVLMQTAGDRDGDGRVTWPVGTWLKQDAVKEIQFFADYGSGFLTGSRFDLFGVLPRMQM